MIRCPKCGTMNRDGSRFCNECGTPVQRTKVRCPKCGTLNPVGNVFCDECNARLVPEAKLPPTPPPEKEPESPTTPLKGISLPVRPAAVDSADTPEEAELPDWLLELTEETTAPAAPTEETTVPTSPTEETVAEPEADLPDWLSGLTDVPEPGPAAPSEPETEPELASADLPDWLSGLGQSEAPAAPAETAEPETVPDWLDGLGGEEETSAVSSEESAAPEDLPDWLSDLSGDSEAAQPHSEEAPQASAVSPPSDAEAEPAALPDWLSALQDEATESYTEEVEEDWLPQDDEEEPSEQALPDWMSGFAEETPEEEPEEVKLPDWLAGVGGEQAPVEAEAAEYEETEVAPAELPDWMSGDEEEPNLEAETAPAELPDWMSGDEEESEPETQEASPAFSQEAPAGLTGAESIASEEGEFQPQPALPEWLLAFADTETDYAPSGPQALPPWLLANADQDTPPYSAPPSELPDWLLKYAEAPPPAAPGRQAPVSVSPPIEETVETEEEAGGSPEPEIAEAAPKPESPRETSAEELPDWLADLQEEEDAPTSEEALALEEELTTGEMPDWLADIVSEKPEAAAEPSEQPPVEEADVPDWLAGGEEVSISESAAPEESLEELPDWLAGGVEEEQVDVEEAPVPEDLPDWLKQGKAEAAPSPTEPAEEIPDWLAGIAEPAGEESASGAIFTEGAPEEAQEPAAPQKQDSTPEWLPDTAESNGLQPAAPAFVPEAGETPEGAPAPDIVEGAPAEAVPDWLNELRPGALEQAAPPANLPVDETLARAEVPSWLRGLKPPGTGPLPSRPDDADIPDFEIPSEEESGLARAEIPDWVQALKATVTTEPEKDLYRQPAEEEGPLMGLPGTLRPHTAVDIPTNYEVPPSPTIPDVITQQAQLWQQLLEQPRGKARPVAQAQKQQLTMSVMTRLLVAALLIVIAALGLFVPGQFWAKVSPSSRPGITKLQSTIDALQPGETVILAVEYGTAEAAEMDMIANTLMAHLAEREVNIIAVSTLPEGVGLAYELLEAQDMYNQLPEENSPYLPGSYNGVAGFLATQQRDQNVSLLLILSSRVDHLTWWIEQNLTFSQPYPMGVGGTAAVGARMSPYLNTRGTDGWLIGFADMVHYREQRGNSLRLVDHAIGLESVLNALMFTHWIALGLIVLGLLYTFATSKKRTK